MRGVAGLTIQGLAAYAIQTIDKYLIVISTPDNQALAAQSTRRTWLANNFFSISGKQNTSLINICTQTRLDLTVISRGTAKW